MAVKLYRVAKPFPPYNGGEVCSFPEEQAARINAGPDGELLVPVEPAAEEKAKAKAPETEADKPAVRRRPAAAPRTRG